MKKVIKKRRKNRILKTGLPPGTLIHTGENREGQAKLTLVHYSQENREDLVNCSLDDVRAAREKSGIVWLVVEGLHDTAMIDQVGTLFGIHPLVLEDIVSVTNRPKVEDYGAFLFITMKFLEFETDPIDLRSDHVCFVLGDRFVITFLDRDIEILKPIFDRLVNPNARFRKSGADYLLYALVDLVVDLYFVTLERFGDALEQVEEQLLLRVQEGILEQLYHLKRIVMSVRKTLWPTRDLINTMIRDDTTLIAETTDVFLRDIYDHTIQIIDAAESHWELLNGMHDVYLSHLSLRMNNVMNSLTIIATIFIPLTFIAGVYGMNFKYMPELDLVWGYPAALVFMSGIGFVMYFWFKRKGWF